MSEPLGYLVGMVVGLLLAWLIFCVILPWWMNR